MARFPEPDSTHLSEQEKEVHVQIRRKYAEFHRKMGLLLQDLVERETVHWTGTILEAQFSGAETRFVDTAAEHVLHVGNDASVEEAVQNLYRSALYVVRDVEVYRATLLDLRCVQSDVMALTGAQKPYSGLLEPIFLEEVDFVRLRAQRVNLDRVATAAHFGESVEKRLAQVKTNATLFETVNPHDAQTQRLYEEIAHLQAVKDKLEQLTDAKVLERTHSLRVMAKVYRRDHKPKEIYIRNAGLMVGGNVKVDVPLRYRQRRSDRVTDDLIAPLASFDNVSLYDYALWQERVQNDTA